MYICCCFRANPTISKRNVLHTSKLETRLHTFTVAKVCAHTGKKSMICNSIESNGECGGARVRVAAVVGEFGRATDRK